MSSASLPSEVHGQWIWHPDADDMVESFVFFRQEFTLDEIPTSAEFWIAANTHYHVYVNGRHFARGPVPASSGKVCVAFYEAAFCLQFGRNVVAVLGHNVDVSRYSNCRKRSGVWCQMNVDGTPLVHTDENWLTKLGDCYLQNQPRVSVTDGFVEAVDMRSYPVDWNQIDYDPTSEWCAPRTQGSLADGRFQISALPDVERVSEPYEYLNLVVYGTAERGRATTHVAFPRAATSAGVYVGEMYIHSSQDADDLSLQVFTDDPTKLYVNHELAFSQGNREPVNWIDPRWNTPRLYGQDELEEQITSVNIKKGTNHVTLVQQVGPNSAGATLIFPEVEDGGIKFVRGKDAISMPGWTVHGPLNMPFSHVEDDLNLNALPSDSYFDEPIDVAANLISYKFDVAERDEEGIPVEEIVLNQGQYMVLELERYARGCLELEVEGTSGDVLDIVYGDSLDGDVVNPIKEGVRKVYSVTLADGMNLWQAVTPHGMKFVMLHCRHASGEVTINKVSVRKTVSNRREPGSFVCADELLNQIWEIGVNTLEATHDSVFLNSSGHQECQYLTDAMLQSFASFYLFGSFDFSQKALREFAQAQYENGEMPTLVPGDFEIRLLDSMLLWPVWLQRHVEHSGDVELLNDMLPHLQRLLIYFETAAGEDSVLLGNTEPPYDNPCIIDYDTGIDRRGISTGLNALYCLSLLRSEWLFDAGGQDEFAKYCNRLASEIAKAIRKLTWDEEKGMFADSWYDGKASSSVSMQTNVLAMISGIAPQDAFEDMFNRIFVEYAPFHKLEIDAANESPFFKYFIMEMAFSMGKRDWATDYMRYYWGGMIRHGATTWWEKFSPDIDLEEQSPASLCNGYGVTASYFLISEVLGIRPAEPGYRQVYFAPNLTALEWATASVPTPNGSLKIDWRFQETGQLEISLDCQNPVDVVLQVDSELAKNAVMKIGDNVSILK